MKEKAGVQAPRGREKGTWRLGCGEEREVG